MPWTYQGTLDEMQAQKDRFNQVSPLIYPRKSPYDRCRGPSLQRDQIWVGPAMNWLRTCYVLRYLVLSGLFVHNTGITRHPMSVLGDENALGFSGRNHVGWGLLSLEV